MGQKKKKKLKTTTHLPVKKVELVEKPVNPYRKKILDQGYFHYISKQSGQTIQMTPAKISMTVDINDIATFKLAANKLVSWIKKEIERTNFSPFQYDNVTILTTNQDYQTYIKELINILKGQPVRFKLAENLGYELYFQSLNYHKLNNDN